MEIYRLEVWAAIDNLQKWQYVPLTDFYTTESPLLEECEKYKEALDNSSPHDNFASWEEFLRKQTEENIVDTRLEYPEIRKYKLITITQ